MVDIAIDVVTGEEVPARNARFGRKYACKCCGVSMHPVLRVPNPYYQCYSGGEHTHSFCRQWFDYGRAYDIHGTDIDKLITGLFRPDKEPTTPPHPPSPGPEPEPEPEPEPVPEDPDDDGGEETGGEEKPEINKVLPCRALHHLWQAGIFNLSANAKIGDAVRSDFFLWFKDFDLLKTTESLGNRILAVRPIRPVAQVNAILFKVFSTPRGESYYEEKYFILKMDDRRQYNRECNRLFDRTENAAGATIPVPKRKMVVIAGDWSEIDHADYATYGIGRGPHCFGAQIAHYYSKKQIYPNPTDPFKTK